MPARARVVRLTDKPRAALGVAGSTEPGARPDGPGVSGKAVHLPPDIPTGRDGKTAAATRGE